jgi:hypothetical protein
MVGILDRGNVKAELRSIKVKNLAKEEDLSARKKRSSVGSVNAKQTRSSVGSVNAKQTPTETKVDKLAVKREKSIGSAKVINIPVNDLSTTSMADSSSENAQKDLIVSKGIRQIGKGVTKAITSKLRTVGENEGLIPWMTGISELISVMQNSGRGSIRSLNKYQRVAIASTVDQFLIENYGEFECFIKDPPPNSILTQPTSHLPESSVEDFQTYLDVQIQNGVVFSHFRDPR